LLQEKKEEIYYPLIKDKLSELFNKKGAIINLEITANGIFSNNLKSKIPSNHEIIFLFLKKAAPDITGYVEKVALPGFIVVEIKKDKIELDDIYQLAKYADLFDAKFAFLISLKIIPEEIKRLLKSLSLLSKLKGSIYKAFTLAQFDTHSNEFTDWFEENPFLESIYWKE